MKRHQARRASGRFTRNTTENTFGFSTVVCESCRRIGTFSAGEPKPENCHACGLPYIQRAPTRAGGEETK